MNTDRIGNGFAFMKASYKSKYWNLLFLGPREILKKHQLN